LKKEENTPTLDFLSETVFLAGHFPPEVSRAMEDEFADLLDRLGYSVLRKRDVKSGIDVIAIFSGEPANPRLPNKCILLRPSFAPEGITGFSLKRGDFNERDVNELLEKIERSRNLNDKILNSLKGAVLVTNYIKTETELDKLYARKVNCWDGRRLTFYAAKARTIFDLASKGPVKEVGIENINNASYLVGTETLPRAILTKIVVWIDDHSKDLIISYDHTKNILNFIYDKSLRPITDSSQLDVQALIKIHILGIAEKTLVGKAYFEYALKETASHPQVVFSATPEIFEYGAAPWTTLLKL
jgi:hypothetical protein